MRSRLVRRSLPVVLGAALVGCAQGSGGGDAASDPSFDPDAELSGNLTGPHGHRQHCRR